MIEIIVAALVAFLALHHLIYAIQNLFNIAPAYAAWKPFSARQKPRCIRAR